MLSSMMPRILTVCVALNAVVGFSMVAIAPASAACAFVTEAPGGEPFWDCPPGQHPNDPTRPVYSHMYTAIALTKNFHGFGGAYGFSLQDAEGTALMRCANAGSGCFVREWARDACVAVAVSLPDGHNVGNWSTERYSARDKALATCRTVAKNCKVVEICTP